MEHWLLLDSTIGKAFEIGEKSHGKLLAEEAWNMTEPLKCQKVVRREDAPDNQGKPVFYHEKCGAPAAEYEIGGLLTKAKAILCGSHKKQADRQAFVSENGYAMGKVDRKKIGKDYKQPRLPGTGVIGDGL